jgi:hypothetical protein
MDETTQAAPSAAATDAQAATQSAASQADAQSAQTATQSAPAAQSAAPQESSPVVPEKYDLKTPDGYTLTGEFGQQFEAVARELKLSNEQAQKLIDLDVKRVEAQKAGMQQARDGWLEQAKTDKEFGGDKLAENVATANKALEKFASPAMIDLLKESGLGNHPEIIRTFLNVGRAMSNDRVVVGQAPAAPSAKDARSMYPNSNMN